MGCGGRCVCVLGGGGGESRNIYVNRSLHPHEADHVLSRAKVDECCTISY